MIRFCYNCGVKLQIEEVYDGYKEQFNNGDIKHFELLWNDNRIQFLCCGCINKFDDDTNVDNISVGKMILKNRYSKQIVNIFDYVSWKIYNITIGWYRDVLENRLNNKRKWKKKWLGCEYDIEIIIENNWLMKIFNKTFKIMWKLRKIIND